MPRISQIPDLSSPNLHSRSLLLWALGSVWFNGILKDCCTSASVTEIYDWESETNRKKKKMFCEKKTLHILAKKK